MVDKDNLALCYGQCPDKSAILAFALGPVTHGQLLRLLISIRRQALFHIFSIFSSMQKPAPDVGAGHSSFLSCTTRGGPKCSALVIANFFKIVLSRGTFCGAGFSWDYNGEMTTLIAPSA